MTSSAYDKDPLNSYFHEQLVSFHWIYRGNWWWRNKLPSSLYLPWWQRVYLWCTSETHSHFCSLPYWLAVHYYFINRLVSIPLNPFTSNKEVPIIKCLAQKNEIRINIDEMMGKKIIKKALSRTITLIPTPYRKSREETVYLPYPSLLLIKKILYHSQRSW